MKRNIDNFDGIREFIISIVTVVAWVLIGSIVIIGYFTIETKGESIMLSFISTIFTIISSLGILATIGVYLWQKNDEKKKQNEINKKLCFFLNEKVIHLQSLLNFIKDLNNKKTVGAKVMLDNNEIIIKKGEKSEYKSHDLCFTQHDKFIENNKLLATYDLMLLIIEVEIINNEITQKTKSYILNTYNNAGKRTHHCSEKSLIDILAPHAIKLKKITQSITTLY